MTAHAMMHEEDSMMGHSIPLMPDADMQGHTASSHSQDTGGSKVKRVRRRSQQQQQLNKQAQQRYRCGPLLQCQ